MPEKDKNRNLYANVTQSSPLKLSVSDQALLDDMDRVTDWKKIDKELDEMYGPEWRKS